MREILPECWNCLYLAHALAHFPQRSNVDVLVFSQYTNLNETFIYRKYTFIDSCMTRHRPVPVWTITCSRQRLGSIGWRRRSFNHFKTDTHPHPHPPTASPFLPANARLLDSGTCWSENRLIGNIYDIKGLKRVIGLFLQSCKLGLYRPIIIQIPLPYLKRTLLMYYRDVLSYKTMSTYMPMGLGLSLP